MKLPAFALLAALLASGAAGAQSLPVGSGVLRFEERLRVGDGCEPYHEVGLMGLAVYPNGVFAAHIDAGTFTGVLVPADGRGRTWELLFDEVSLAFYKLYLEAGARAVCGTHASITGGGVHSFVLRLTKGGTQAVLKLRSSATGTGPLRAGLGRHRIDGKGRFGSIRPSPGSQSGAGLTMRSLSLGS